LKARLSSIGWLIGAILLAVGLRCFRLGQNSLWIDEYASLTTALAPLAEMPAAAIRGHAFNPPIYFWILHLTVRALGEGEAALRIPSVVAGVLTIPILWLLAYEVTRNRWVANLSAILLAANPLHLWYSQEARPYALLVLFSSAALWSLAVALRTSALRWWAGFAVFSSLAILTHVIGLVTLLLGAFWVVFRGHDRGLLRRYAAASLGAVTLASPFLIMLARAVATAEGTGSPARTYIGLELPYTIYTYLAGYSLGPSIRELQDLEWRAALLNHPVGVAFVLAVLVALGWLTLRLRSAAARDLAIVFLVPLVAATAVSIATTKAYNVRYTLQSVIGFIPLVALALAQLRPAARRVGTGVLLGTFLWSDAQWFASPEYRKEDSRAAVACLRRNLPPGATVLVAPAYMANLLAYYASRSQTPLHVIGLDTAEDLNRVHGAQALLVTRLHHVPDAAALLRGFTGGEEPRLSGGVIGYRLYLANSTPVGRPQVCLTRSIAHGPGYES
jgi:uncharacterized membrane protein